MNKIKKNDTRAGQLSIAASYILPYLPPVELSTVSLTCKTLNLIAKSVAATRSSDAARNMEKLPIPFVSSGVYDHPYAYFMYTPTQIVSFPDDPPMQPWGRCYDGQPDSGLILPPVVVDCFRCECEKCGGDLARCPCSRSRQNAPGLKWECGLGCTCGLKCENRLSQRGVPVRLKIVRSQKKGWGLHADQFIRGGEFICEYAGELFDNKRIKKTSTNI